MSSPQPPSDRSHLEVADIFRAEAAAFFQTHGGSLSTPQKRVFSNIQACRTAALGGHVRECAGCEHGEIAYNSCRNRHCPKCQAMARAQWLVQREAELLPIAYFHIVFTLPAEIAALALQNKRLLYGMLFQASSETLQEVAANPRHLGAAQIGVLAVLHTWGQNLPHHPHLHCVVGGGGLSQEESRWIASRDYFFLPVKVLSRVFRNKFRRLLEKAFARGELSFFGKLVALAHPAAFRHYLDAATQREWVVFAKRPFRNPACALKHLARYTHRVAIANQHLIEYRAGQVTFHYKDYARQGAQRTMTLAAAEFIRRFLLHVLPDGFMRIRHYGYLANRHRQEQLALCRRLPGCETTIDLPENIDRPEPNGGDQADETETTMRCPICQTGRMRMIERFERSSRRFSGQFTPLLRSFEIHHDDSS